MLGPNDRESLCLAICINMYATSTMFIQVLLTMLCCLPVLHNRSVTWEQLQVSLRNSLSSVYVGHVCHQSSLQPVCSLISCFCSCCTFMFYTTKKFCTKNISRFTKNFKCFTRTCNFLSTQTFIFFISQTSMLKCYVDSER